MHSYCQFITADVYGVFCWSFCDFGDSFEVADTNGEEPKETLIANITKVKVSNFRLIAFVTNNGIVLLKLL